MTRLLTAALLLLQCSTAAPLPRTEPAFDRSNVVIPFLEERIKADPADFVALNRLSDAYLRRMRATGDHGYIPKARAAAVASLEAVSAEVNPGGLAALARAEAAGHRFEEARKHALRLIELQPDKPEPYLLLHDAAYELGSYDEAENAIARARSHGPDFVAFSSRAAKIAFIRGDIRLARKHLLAIAGATTWGRWQLGELEFSQGKLHSAQHYVRDALKSDPESIHIMASLAKLEAGRGNLDEAVSLYERVIAKDPVPLYVAALADLYLAAGRGADSEALLQRIEENAANPLDSELDNRQLALIWADHDRNLEAAYQRAAREYARRRDVYGADVLAWTALKTGRLDQAHEVIERALQYGTRDARIYYHAGMIEKARGNRDAARTLLRRALLINPFFDFRQSAIARRALDER